MFQYFFLLECKYSNYFSTKIYFEKKRIFSEIIILEHTKKHSLTIQMPKKDKSSYFSVAQKISVSSIFTNLKTTSAIPKKKKIPAVFPLKQLAVRFMGTQKARIPLQLTLENPEGL